MSLSALLFNIAHSSESVNGELGALPINPGAISNRCRIKFLLSFRYSVTCKK